MIGNGESLLLYLTSFSLSAYMLSIYKKNKKYLIYLLVAMIIPVLIAGMRGLWCGADSHVYIGSASNPTTNSFIEIIKENGIFESLHQESYKLARLFHTPRAPLIFWAIITIVFIVLWILKTTQDPGITYFMYLFLFFSTGMNVSRQYMALSIVVFASQFIIERKWLKFYICILISLMLHTSAVFLIPTYFLWTRDNKVIDRKICVLILISLIVFVSQLQGVLEGFSEYDTGVSSINRYISYTDEASSKNRDFFLECFTTAIILLHAKQLIDQRNDNELYILMICMGVCLNAAGFVSPFVKRIAVYFTIYKIVLIPQIAKLYYGKNRLIANALIVIYVVMLFIVIYFVLGQGRIFPYSWEIPRTYWLNL